VTRQQEMKVWPEQRWTQLTEYDDTLTRKFVERIVVVDAEIIQVKIKNIDVVITRKLS